MRTFARAGCVVLSIAFVAGCSDGEPSLGSGGGAGLDAPGVSGHPDDVSAGDDGVPGGGASGTGGGGGDGVTEVSTCLGDLTMDDFEDPSTYALFRPYHDQSAGGVMSPAPGAAFSPATSDTGGSALHMTGSGFSSWGAGIGRSFDVPHACKERALGVRFRAKGNGPITVAAPVSAVVPTSEGGSCTAADGCNNSHEASVILTSTWATHEVYWTDLAQLDGWGIPATFDPKSVLEILFAARPEAMPFDFWIDDIELIDSGAPVEPEPEPDPGTGGDTSNPGGTCVLDGILGKTGFESWFSARRNPFYTYESLCTALAAFPKFAASGNATTDKQEVAAFFANVARETGELQYIDQLPDSRGSTGNYFGRGPLQLTWDYNYRAAGEFLGVDLLSNPNLLSNDAVMTWKASLWFWVHSDGAAKGTCNAAIVQGRGFGQTIDIINGGLECPSANNSAAQQRVTYFTTFCSRLSVPTGSNLNCN